MPDRLLIRLLIVTVLFRLISKWRTNSLASSLVYWLISLSPTKEIKTATAVLGRCWSMFLKVRYSSAISVILNDLGLKLDWRYGIFIGLIVPVVPIHQPSNTSLRRFEYAAASLGHLDKACLMDGP